MKADHGSLTDYARVVVDTNVLLSAAPAPNGVPAELIDWLLTHGRLVFSPETFAELETRIWKPKFDRYLPVERRKRLLRELNASAQWFEVPPVIAELSFSRDTKDDIFVHLAMTAQVNRLISGDDDLLCLHPLGALHILSPRAAFDEITELRRNP
jgi:putative PIN family toxin of toxin-antitoxin system